MAEGEVVELGVVGEEGGDVWEPGAGNWVRGGEGEVSADDGDERGEGDEEVEVPVEGAAGCLPREEDAGVSPLRRKSVARSTSLRVEMTVLLATPGGLGVDSGVRVFFVA